MYWVLFKRSSEQGLAAQEEKFKNYMTAINHGHDLLRGHYDQAHHDENGIFVFVRQGETVGYIQQITCDTCDDNGLVDLSDEEMALIRPYLDAGVRCYPDGDEIETMKPCPACSGKAKR